MRLALAANGKKEQPFAEIFDGRTVQFTPECGEWAGYHGYKRKKRKIYIAVDTLGLLLAAHVTPVNEKELAEGVQEVMYKSIVAAFVNQSYTGDNPKALQKWISN